MTEHQRKILDTILGVVREKYADDIALMLIYGSAVNGTADERSDLDIFYIPAEEKGHNLAKTFIMDGIGYDIWCGSWSTLHNMLMWSDMRVSILADSEVVYTSKEVYRKDYELMRQNAINRTKWSNNAHDYEPALEFLKKAKAYFGELCLGETAAAGGILMELVNAVCYVNRRYLKYGTKKILDELSEYPLLPEKFTENYSRAIREPENTTAICREMIGSTENFIHAQFRHYLAKGKCASSCTGMYEEISSHWNKIRRCCEAGDAEGAFIAAASLQHDLDYLKITVGESFDLFGGWNPRDLGGFCRHCDAVEKEVVRLLGENGVPVCYVENHEELRRILLESYDLTEA